MCGCFPITSRQACACWSPGLPSYGIGLTDLVKTLTQSHDRGLGKHYAVGGAGSRVFVLPNSSGAANGGPFAPLASRPEWWRRLADNAT
jgi:hypothetical protein